MQYFLAIRVNEVPLRVLQSRKMYDFRDRFSFAVQKNNVCTAKYVSEGMAWIYSVCISYIFISK